MLKYSLLANPLRSFEVKLSSHAKCFSSKTNPCLISRVHTYIIEFHLIFCFSDAFSSSVQQEPIERAKFRMQPQIMDSKLSIILISARTNLKYLKTVFQIAAWEFHLNLMTVTRWGWKDLQSRNLLCFPDKCSRKSNICTFMINLFFTKKKSTERTQILQEFKLQCNKSRGGKQRMPMDLYFCSTSAKKQNQTKTLFFPDTLIYLTPQRRLH